MSCSGAGLLSVSSVIVLIAAGTDGVPLSCRPDTICFKDYNKEKFHRLKIECRDLAVILDGNGDVFGGNVFYDKGGRCITWRDGILSDCAVTETDDSGRKSRLLITYNCTADALTTEVPKAGTSPQAAPPSSVPKVADYTRHTYAIIAVVTVPVLLVLLISSVSNINVFQLLHRMPFGCYHRIILLDSSSPGNPKEICTS